MRCTCIVTVLVLRYWCCACLVVLCTVVICLGCWLWFMASGLGTRLSAKRLYAKIRTSVSDSEIKRTNFVKSQALTFSGTLSSLPKHTLLSSKILSSSETQRTRDRQNLLENISLAHPPWLLRSLAWFQPPGVWREGRLGNTSKSCPLAVRRLLKIV